MLTFKEGLLSRLAHDLELGVDSFEITVSDGESANVRIISAWFAADSVQVIDAMVSGRRAPGVLGERDKRKIEATIKDEVLTSKRHARITFEGTATRTVSTWQVSGRLTVVGKSQPVQMEAVADGEHSSVQYTLHQPSFGIKPYSAMLGALKLKPDVQVRVSLHTLLPTA